ncbi:tRNA (adenosine(37)-N6)-threonylcarbamoyltransferase complex transferase subunit TsaD [Candidatus Mycoplasma mahonii]|uniref:tRNA (adenosine(37)-N6)-threonylcarbamoyltransferase complex transferase subunit TsaD n=1 Tax=Candidatus Mycoplasma mahonii TaxID=3004105 RepID=UPI0026EF60D0|nr:tRNA (adenosine(37)-N6)-threonylcarbamoyltransferase complex transferase subunit TsaD [Candidatus Mycoplasma mahonii]WKX02424.1 tRNA (adenosine(37)-N6)-threonylcarbamoyltransferase complex transferase subunit TsaD [Candidatus Mycoplasma mahonii]
MKILAIESSHDDTSVVLFEDKKIIFDVSFAQTDFHKSYGGTVPEYAARKHCDILPIILDRFIKEQNLSDIDHIAYTNEPGLIGSLQMGRLFAYGLGFSLNIPVKPINHIFAHIYAVEFDHEIKYPALALIVSGGHTQLWNVKGINDIKLLGETRDDAAGEAFDKISRKLGAGFPGGPAISKLAEKGLNNINFKIQMTSGNDFSFSGLKTKVINYIHNLEQKNELINNENIACSFQDAIVSNLIDKTKQAFMKGDYKSIIIGGGVSANNLLRRRILDEFASLALIPSKKFTTDNAAMIAIRSFIKEQ